MDLRNWEAIWQAEADKRLNHLLNCKKILRSVRRGGLVHWESLWLVGNGTVTSTEAAPERKCNLRIMCRFLFQCQVSQCWGKRLRNALGYLYLLGKNKHLMDSCKTGHQAPQRPRWMISSNLQCAGRGVMSSACFRSHGLISQHCSTQWLLLRLNPLPTTWAQHTGVGETGHLLTPRSSHTMTQARAARIGQLEDIQKCTRDPCWNPHTDVSRNTFKVEMN